MLAFLADAYDEEGEGKQQRVVLRFHPDIAPFQVAVIGLTVAWIHPKSVSLEDSSWYPAGDSIAAAGLPAHRCIYL